MDRTLLMVAVFLTALVLVACSSDEPSTSAPPIERPPTEAPRETPESEAGAASERERFIAKADRMCQRMLNEFRLLPRPTDLDSAVRFTRKANALSEQMLIRLRALTPARYRKALSRNYEESERLLALASGEVLEALQAGDMARYESLAIKINKATRKLNAELRRFGFGACAEPS